MRGRHAVGPEIADTLDGSEYARTRMRVVLEVTAGRMRVTEACAVLGVCSQRFERIRRVALQWGIPGLERKRPGRPRKPRSAVETESAELRQQVAEARAQLQAARVRIELAEGLPRLAGKKS